MTRAFWIFRTALRVHVYSIVITINEEQTRVFRIECKMCMANDYHTRLQSNKHKDRHFEMDRIIRVFAQGYG